MTAKRYLTVAEVAETLRVHPETVKRWLRRGELKGSRPGGSKIGWRISQDDLDAFMREKMGGE